MGKLYLLGNNLGNIEDTPMRTRQMLETLPLIIYEHEHSLLKLAGELGLTITGETLRVSHKDLFEKVEQHLQSGDAGLIVDLGYPLVADPGRDLGRYLVERGYVVEIIPGPSISSTAQVLSLLDGGSADFIWFELYHLYNRDVYDKLEPFRNVAYNLVMVDHPSKVENSLSIISKMFEDRPTALIFEMGKPDELVVRTPASEVVERYQEYIESNQHINDPYLTIVIARA